VKHLIADNKELLDFPEFGRNIEEYMAAQNNGERYVSVAENIIINGQCVNCFMTKCLSYARRLTCV
jgi:hypothetical protein